MAAERICPTSANHDMSGPKCGEWSVESNHERERRIGAELRADINSVRRALDEVRERWGAATKKYGTEFPNIPSHDNDQVSHDADNGTIRKILEQSRARLTALENELAEAESVYRIRYLLSKASSIKKAVTVSDSDRANKTTVSIETRRQKVIAAIELLDPGTSDNEREVIEQWCKEILQEVHASKFNSTLLEIKLRIQRFNRKRKERELVSSKVERLLESLTGLEGKEVSRLRQELVLALGEGIKLRSGIEVEVVSAAAAAVAEEDRRYVSKVLIEELEKLGYSTDGGMQTVLAEGGELQINNADLKEYAVCLAVNQNNRRFDVLLTRSSDATESISSERRLRDRSMEEKWCSDLATVLASAGERGVATRIVCREKPGVVPIVVRNRNERRRSLAVPRARSMRFTSAE